MSTVDAAPSSRHLRKGTRACQECRRRKIKCTYANEVTAICRECSENKRLCERQGSFSISRGSASGIAKSNPSRLKVRVTRLESVVERLAKGLPQDGPTEILRSENRKGNLDDRSNFVGFDERSEPSLPIYALFRNEVISTTDNLCLPPAVDHTISFNQPYVSSRELLLSTIAKENDILTVLDISNVWWPPFRNHYAAVETPFLHLHESLLDFVVHSLAAEDPIHISFGLVAIAMSLQTLRPGVDDQSLYLSASCTETMNRILAAVDQFVLNTEDQHDSESGMVGFSKVVLILLRGKLYAESNQLRKAWLGVRRALLLAQKIVHDDEQLKPFLDALLESERFFSMFLGLPYVIDASFEGGATSGADFAGRPVDDLTTRMRSLRRASAVAAEETNDRNARNDDMALKKTIATQHRLDTAVGAMPPEFWDIDTLTAILDSPATIFEHLNAQFWFFQIQLFLQLPYMFDPDSSLDDKGSRSICLRSCRGLVRVWMFLRQSKDMEAYLCRLDDFQAFTASTVLLVGILLQGINGGEESCQQDIEVLEDVKCVFRGLEKEQTGSIARQGLRVLETLGKFIEPADWNSGDTGEMREVTLFVPYLGAITVQAGKRLSSFQQLPNSNMERFQSGEDPSFLQAYSGDTLDSLDSEGYLEDGMFELDQIGGNNKTEDLALDLFDWEKFMMGTELNQDWNEQLLPL